VNDAEKDRLRQRRAVIVQALEPSTDASLDLAAARLVVDG
jgi:hypothetical protein